MIKNTQIKHIMITKKDKGEEYQTNHCQVN